MYLKDGYCFEITFEKQWDEEDNEIESNYKYYGGLNGRLYDGFKSLTIEKAISIIEKVFFMKDITIEYLINIKKLKRKYNSFTMSYMIYSYLTKIEFIFERIGSVRVYLHQSDDNDKVIRNTILLGIIKTELELKKILTSLTRDEKL